MDRICVPLCLLTIGVALSAMVYCSTPPPEVVVELTTEIVVAKPTEAKAQTVVETEPPIVLYNVPLDAELQLHIIAEADGHGIDPAIIVAMAYRESTYNESCIGDGGDSYGLLQVQPKWHYERMQKLGCTDLLDPRQNVTVAVDYLCELLNRYGDTEKALTAYNRGNYNGTITQYAKTILAHAEKLNNERSQ